MIELIQGIHNSDMFGIFIEMGLGNPVSTKLCEVPGASKTIFCAENPYNDEYSRNLFGLTERIVSLKTIRKIMDSDHVATLSFKNRKINTVYISSFQIGNYNDKSTHGYIGIKKGDNEKYYHISIHDSLSRSEYIKIITECSVYLLNDFRSDDTDAWNIGLNIDAIWNRDLNPIYDETLYFIGSDWTNFCYIENGKLLRLEDLCRQASEGLLMYKGSFNPITKAHVKLISESEKLYPKYKSCYSISLNTWGKEVDMINLMERIHLINSLGYGVLIYGSPMFDDIHENIIKKYDKPVVYLMGADTNNRFIEAKPKWNLPNRRFIVSSRKGSTINSDPEMIKRADFIEMNVDISATRIRNAILSDDFESVKNDIPDLLSDKLDKFKKTIS